MSRTYLCSTMLYCSKAWTGKLNICGTQAGRYLSEDSLNRAQDFKGWLRFSFEFFWRENGEKLGRKELLQLDSLHNLIQGNYKMWQSWSELQIRQTSSLHRFRKCLGWEGTLDITQSQSPAQGRVNSSTLLCGKF